MNILEIVAKQLNRFQYCFNVQVTSSNSIRVYYRLQLPKWANDKEIITKSSQSIVYNKRLGTDKSPRTEKFIVDLKNVDDSYPNCSNRKFLRESVDYTLAEIVDKDVHSFFYKEREKYLKIIKSNIALEKVGEATRQWEAICDGKVYTPKEKYEKSNWYIVQSAFSPF